MCNLQTSCRTLLLTLSLFVAFNSATFAIDVDKANNSTDLNLGGSWVGAAVPGTGDVAVWNDTVTGANTTALGGSLSWQGIKVTGSSQSGLVRINGTNIPLTLGTAGIDLSNSVRNLTIYTSVVLGSAQSWDVGTGRTLTIGDYGTGTVTGSGALTKKGAGTLIMASSGAGNNYSGDLIVEGGTLAVKYDGTRSATGNIYLKNNTTVANQDASDTSLVVAGSSRKTFLDGNVTFVGTNGGTSATTRLILGGSVVLTGNRTINVSNAVNANGGGFVEIPSGAGNGISDSGSNYSLTKTGIGTLKMLRTSTYTGGTYVEGGILELNTFNNLLAAGTLIQVDGGNLYLNGVSQTAGTVNLLSGSITGSGGSLTGTSFNMSSGTSSKVLAGTSAALTKSTSGTLILSANNTYTGTTAVNGGVLLVTSAGSISDSSAITVNAGSTLAYNSATTRTGSITLNGSGTTQRATLSGSGMINAALTLDNLGDTLSPGNSPGIRQFGVSQSWESFTYLWETNNFTGTTAGTDFDQIAITGSLALSGGIGDYVLDLTSLTAGNSPGDVSNFSEINRSWSIITTTTGITGFDVAHWTIDDGNFSSDPAWTGAWGLSVVGNDLVLAYSAVPEPGTTALVACSLALLGFFRSRKFSRSRNSKILN